MGDTISIHERAHWQAKQRDARNSYSVGDDLDVVIEEDPAMNNGQQAVTHVGNLVVFVHPGEISLAVGSCMSGYA
jgi:hypothetical protein